MSEDVAVSGQSVAVAVQLNRLDNGELSACFGIEGHAEMQAEAPELRWVERHSEGHSTMSAGLLLALLGTSMPITVPIRQKVTVFHHGLDLAVLISRVPKLGRSL